MVPRRCAERAVLLALATSSGSSPEGFTASPGRFSNTGRRGEAGGSATDPEADRGSGGSGG